LRAHARLLALALATHTLLSAASILLISIDGMRPDSVTRADEHGLKIPNLRRFVAEGTYAEGVTGVTPTITYPSHTTLITGVWPVQHGILGNVRFDPLLENMGGWYWYATDIRVPTLWSAADDAGMVVASENWPASVGAKGVRYLIPEYWRAHTPDDRKLIEALSRPDGWLQELESKLGPYTNGNDTTLGGDERERAGETGQAGRQWRCDDRVLGGRAVDRWIGCHHVAPLRGCRGPRPGEAFAHRTGCQTGERHRAYS
jgi:hypothetical protein